jgi:hypothetical protein
MAKTKTPAVTIRLDESPQAAQGLTLLAQAKAITVIDKASHAACLETLKGAKALKRTVEEHYAAIKRPLNDARATVLQMEKDHLAPLDEAIRVLENVATAYAREQKRIEQEEAARQQREAEARERQRRELEAQQAEEAALTLESSSNVLSEREQKFVASWMASSRSPQAIIQAAKVAGYANPQQQGERLLKSDKIQQAIANAEKAAAIRRESEAKQAAPVLVEVAPVQSQVASVSGTSMRTYYGCGDVDLSALILAVAENIKSGDGTMIQALQADMVYLNAQARALKDMFSRVWPMAKLVKRDGVAG